MLLLAIHVSSLEKYLSSLLPYLNWVVLSLGLLGSSVGKESTCNAGASGSIPGSGRSLGEGIGYPLQYSWASLVAQLVKSLPAMWDILEYRPLSNIRFANIFSHSLGCLCIFLMMSFEAQKFLKV